MTTAPVPTATLGSLETFIRQHQTHLWRYLRFLGCDPAQADDLTQETFLKVLDKPLADFGGGGARAYLCRTAKNALLKWRERDQRLARVDLATAEMAFAWACVEGDDGTRTLDALGQCLDELAPSAQQALQLRYGEELQRGEIGARLGLGDHGVKSLLQRTYARLRACIERRLRHDDA
ncbi:MAG: sigma-70 family RNA polymerase sigma factor [Planctomycetota bacterium]